MIDFCIGVTVKSVRKSNRLKKMKPATSKNAKFASERKNIKHRKDETALFYVIQEKISQSRKVTEYF